MGKAFPAALSSPVSRPPSSGEQLRTKPLAELGADPGATRWARGVCARAGPSRGSGRRVRRKRLSPEPGCMWRSHGGTAASAGGALALSTVS